MEILYREIFISFNVTKFTLQDKFYNIFVHVNSSTWTNVCAVTIRLLIKGVLRAGRNGILVQFHYQEKSNFKFITIIIKMGGSFFENHNLIPSFHN